MEWVPSESAPQELSNEWSCQYVSKILNIFWAISVSALGDKRHHQSLKSSLVLFIVIFLQEPTVTGLHPQYGPISGDTNITISGHQLDIGSVVQVLVGQSPCKVKR
jgi:hypothetical protein